MHILYSVQTRTHPGRVRANNQDAYGVILEWRKKLDLTDADLQTRGHLFAVADGMGGHAAGEVASQLAIETLFREYYASPWQSPKANLKAAIAAANQTILDEAEKHPEMAGMGTTLVAALYRPDDGWLIANVGDSRAYLFREGRIAQVTQDHSWVAEQARSGILTQEQAAHHPLRNIITRSLGGEEDVTPDFFRRDSQPGDILLLCSDGLSNLVDAAEMAKLLKSYPLDEAAEKLEELALERGAPDNVTFILIQMVGGKRRRSRSFLPWLALTAAILILGGFLFWTYARPQPSATPAAPVVALATNTPIPPPSSPTPKTPTPSATPPIEAMAVIPPSPIETPTPDQLVVLADPVEVAAVPGVEGSPEGFVFVQGPATVVPGEETKIIITHYGLTDGVSRDYVASLPQNALSGQVIGAEQAVLGLPQGESTGEQRMAAAWFLGPFGGDDNLFAAFWLAPEAERLVDARSTVLLYTVNGRGGGDSLGIDAPPGEEGKPIAVLGVWEWTAWDDILTFSPAQVYDYDESDQGYHPRP